MLMKPFLLWRGLLYHLVLPDHIPGIVCILRSLRTTRDEMRQLHPPIQGSSPFSSSYQPQLSQAGGVHLRCFVEVDLVRFTQFYTVVLWSEMAEETREVFVWLPRLSSLVSRLSSRLSCDRKRWMAGKIHIQKRRYGMRARVRCMCMDVLVCI
jgi:hypothetical protein